MNITNEACYTDIPGYGGADIDVGVVSRVIDFRQPSEKDELYNKMIKEGSLTRSDALKRIDADRKNDATKIATARSAEEARHVGVGILSSGLRR